jgi:hypothetical protein
MYNNQPNQPNNFQQFGNNYNPNGFLVQNQPNQPVYGVQQQPNYFSNQQPNYYNNVPSNSGSVGNNSQIPFVPQNLKKNSFDGFSSFNDQVGSFNGGTGNGNVVGNLKPNAFFGYSQPQEQNVFQPQFQSTNYLQQQEQPKHIYYEDKSTINNSKSFEHIYGQNLYQQESKQFDQNPSNVSFTMNQIPEEIVSPNAPYAPELRYFNFFLILKF